MSVKAVAAAPAVERIGSYRLKKTLGIGSFGKVCLYTEVSAARDHGALPSFRVAPALNSHPSTSKHLNRRNRLQFKPPHCCIKFVAGQARRARAHRVACSDKDHEHEQGVIDRDEGQGADL